MSENKEQRTKNSGGGTGLALHGSTAAFTTARAMTSHLRRRYHERYRGRSRFAPFLFAFDLSLFVIAILLVGLNAYLFTVLPPTAETYRLDLVTAEIKTAAPVSLEARVTALGDGPHENIRLVWQLPPGVEILQSEPSIDDDGQAQLGSLKPGETVSSRLVVRIFAPQGPVRFGFRLIDVERSLFGAETRRLSGSGLVFDPLVTLSSVEQGVPVLYRLANETNLPLEDVRLVSENVGRLEPFEERVMPVTPTTQGPIRISATIRGVSIIERVEPYALLSSDPTGVQLALEPSGGPQLSFTARADRAAAVAVWHPGLSDANHLRILDIPAGKSDIRLPVQSVPGETKWYAVPFAKRPEGNALGRPVSAPITTELTILTSARYYAVFGDQIGVGPLPPRVGEATKIWVGLRMGPTTSDLSDVRVRVSLASNVRVTGRDALPDGGSFLQTDDELVWNLGYLPADADGANASFEIELTPDASQRGTVPVLVESVRVEASDVRTGIFREASFGRVDMNLVEDEKGKNKGTVK